MIPQKNCNTLELLRLAMFEMPTLYETFVVFAQFVLHHTAFGDSDIWSIVRSISCWNIDLLLNSTWTIYSQPPQISLVSFLTWVLNFAQRIVSGIRFTGIPDQSWTFHGFSGMQMNFVAPIPEPSTLALFSIGALGMFGYGWRRRVRHR